MVYSRSKLRLAASGSPNTGRNLVAKSSGSSLQLSKPRPCGLLTSSYTTLATFRRFSAAPRFLSASAGASDLSDSKTLSCMNSRRSIVCGIPSRGAPRSETSIRSPDVTAAFSPMLRMLTKTAALVLAFDRSLINSAGFGAHHTRTPAPRRHEGFAAARRSTTGRARAADYALLRTPRLRDRDLARLRIRGGARARLGRARFGRGAALRRARERGSGRAAPGHDAADRAHLGHAFGRPTRPGAALLSRLGHAPSP